MQVQTPSTARHKITHTPPSESSSSATSAKFLKDVTGKGLKKIGSKFSKSPSTHYTVTTPETEYVEQFPSEPKNIKGMKEQLGLFRRRPTPLDFGVLTPPSTSIKKKSIDSTGEKMLASPLEVNFKSKNNTDFPSKWTWEKAVSDGGVHNDLLAFHMECFDDISSINRDNVYDGQMSPTEMMQMKRNIRKATETKKYLSKDCILCHESLQVLLDGEKIIELACGHHCHMDCFIAGTDLGLNSVQCSECNSKTTLLNEEVLNEVKLKKFKEPLTIKDPMDFKVAPQLPVNDQTEVVVQSLSANSFSSSCNFETSGRKLETPMKQLINTAQLSENGFHEPLRPLYEDVSPFSLRDSKDLKSSLSVVEPEFNITVSPQIKKCKVNENSSNVIFPHALNVYVPGRELESKQRLKLLVCLSLINCSPNEVTNEDYCKNLKDTFNQVISSLDENDELGLVLVGRDGCGNISSSGTFYGFVSKKWYGWDEIFDGLTISENNESIFPNQIWELKCTLEAASRLLSTLTETNEKSIRHIIILTRNYDIKRKFKTLNDLSMIKRIEKILNKIMSEYEFTISHWLPENQVNAFFLKDYSPRCNHSISTKFFPNDDELPLREHINWLHGAIVDRLVVTLRTFDGKIANFHSIEFNGTLTKFDMKTDKEELIMGPFSGMDHKTVLLEVIAEPKMIKSYLDKVEPTTRLSFEEYLSNGLNFIPILNYTATYSNGKKYIIQKSDGLMIDFDTGYSSPMVSSVASVFHVARRTPEIKDVTSNSVIEGKDDSTLFLDLPLVPPMSPSSDSVFIARQMELVIIESLRNIIATASLHNSIKTMTMELHTVLFGMSRGYNFQNPNTIKNNTTVDQKYRRDNYVEKLTLELEKIAECTDPIQKMKILIQKLK